MEAGGVFTGGSIYEIQDVHNFIVEATVDEYDVVDIKEGQTAYVVTDSLGDEELEGVVTYVSPVGTSGQTMGSASGTASYEIQITINEPQEKLRSGMTASVSIALEESKDTLAVPYDCVQTNEAGESVIYVEDNGERKEIAVETGIETDYYIEVISDEISEGMTVYLNTPLLQSGGAGALPDASQTGEEGTMEFDFGGGMPSGGALWYDSRVPAVVELFSFLLEASTLDEIESFFKTTKANFAYIVGVADGQTARCFEWPVFEVKRRESHSRLGLTVLTNHFTEFSWGLPRPDDKRFWMTRTRRQNLLTLAKHFKGSINDKVMKDIMDTRIEDLGATTDMTVYQLVVVPERYELWFKLPGVQDWSLIDMRALLKPREE